MGATGKSAIGIFFNMPLFCEGMNEKGLTGGLFYFPGFAEFQKVPNLNFQGQNKREAS